MTHSETPRFLLIPAPSVRRRHGVCRSKSGVLRSARMRLDIAHLQRISNGCHGLAASQFFA